MSNGSPFLGQISQWQQYANKGDAKSIKSLYMPDAVALFTEGPVINGAAAIETDLANHFGAGSPYTNLVLEEEGYQQQGNWGWSYGTWNTGKAATDPSGSSRCIRWSPTSRFHRDRNTRRSAPAATLHVVVGRAC
jgi:ketosteroid isomerase-like protein